MFLAKKVLPMKTIPATGQPCVPSLPGEVSGVQVPPASSAPPSLPLACFCSSFRGSLPLVRAQLAGAGRAALLPPRPQPQVTLGSLFFLHTWALQSQPPSLAAPP